MNSFLQKPVNSLNMIGEEYAKRLAKLNIFTINDLLHHYPFHYDDASQKSTISQINPGQHLTLTGTVISINSIHTRGGKTLQKALFADDTGTLSISWFNQPYLVKTLTHNPNINVSGIIKSYRGQLSLSSPQFELLNPDKPQTIHTGRLVPRYHQTAGVSSKWLRSRITGLLKDSVTIPDWLPNNILSDHNLIDLKSALKAIHFPETTNQLNQAIDRLKFNELFLLQLVAQLKKKQWQQYTSSHPITIDPSKHQHFINHLPFKLTSAQQRSVREILADLTQNQPMNRLLQGDVGSGKTVVAAAAIYHAHHNNLTSILLAPTEVLANQHATTISQILAKHNITISVQTRNRKDTHQASVIIGTHALLHRHLPDNIGLVVIDEQHRFGVKQRARIINQSITPHVLSMTATPIPRTIALTLYADLDVSVIDQLPPGRKPIKTWLVSPNKRHNAYQWIDRQIKDLAAQVFVVCPLINDSETPMLDQVKAVESEYLHLKNNIFPNHNIGLLHGNQSAKNKQDTINQFRNHQLNILVATPVIEVGIDIPNASIILIEAAERFGLASLHQLRGRVGRGDQDSYCLLFTSTGKATSRLKAMEKVHQGIELAQLDLKLRGAGDMYGVKQSGHIDLKIASLSDQKLITLTHQAAVKYLQTDPDFINNPSLLEQINSMLEKDIQPN